MGGIVLFLLNCKSRNEFNLMVKDKCFSQNYFRMFGLGLSLMDAVNDLFEIMKPEELQEVRCLLINALINKRVFHKFRFFGNCFCVAIDGTGVYNWGDTPPESILPYALKKEYSKSGKVNYSSQILEAVMVCSNGLVVPLMSEWIANDGLDYDKQDCELKAFKRLSVRLKKCFPRLKLCILADGMYSNVSMMNLCDEYGWKFTTVFKDGNLPSVWQEVESLLPLSGASHKCQQQICNRTHWITSDYCWIKNLEYQKYRIHWLECVQISKHRQTGEETTNRFVFLTNWDVNDKNIFSILQAGRARWRIEDHFNTQKNRDGALPHKFNRNNFNAIKNWHNLRQLGCMMREMVKYTSELKQVKNEIKKMTWKELWKNLNSLLTMLLIEDIITDFENWSKSARQIRLE